MLARMVGENFYFIFYFGLTPLTPPEVPSLKILFFSFFFFIDEIVVHFLFVLYQ